MCVYICLFACPTAKVRNYPAILHQIIPARYPSYDKDSVLLWRRCDMLSISGLWVIYLSAGGANVHPIGPHESAWKRHLDWFSRSIFSTRLPCGHMSNHFDLLVIRSTASKPEKALQRLQYFYSHEIYYINTR